MTDPDQDIECPNTIRRRAISVAIRLLPLAARPDISDLVSNAVESLVLLTQPEPKRQRPNAFTQGTASERGEELSKVAAKSAALADLLDNLHGSSISAIAIGAGAVDLCGLSNTLRGLAGAITSTSLPPLKTSGRGSPPKRRAEGITTLAANHYRELTGQEPTFTKPTENSSDPTWHGPFVNFLAVLFDVASVDAQPLSQAEKLRNKHRKNRS